MENQAVVKRTPYPVAGAGIDKRTQASCQTDEVCDGAGRILLEQLAVKCAHRGFDFRGQRAFAKSLGRFFDGELAAGGVRRSGECQTRKTSK